MKQCESCKFRHTYEWEKPCMGYRDGCQLYQKGEDMTRDEAIKELSEMRTDAWTDSRQMKALEMASKALAQEPKTGRWIYQNDYIPYRWKCNQCSAEFKTDYNYCPNCGAKMIEPQESEVR